MPQENKPDRNDNQKSAFHQPGLTADAHRSVAGFRGGPGGSRHGMPRHGMPFVKPKDFRKTLFRLWQYFGRERKILTVIFTLVILGAFIGLLGPWLTGRCIDAMAQGRNAVDFGLLATIVMVLAASYLGDAGITFLQGFFMAGVSQRIIFHMRAALFAKLHQLPISFFDRQTHGDMMSRLTNDIDNISGAISQSTVQLMSNVITIAGSLTMMLILSMPLTLAAVIVIPLVFLLTRIVTKRTRGFFREQQNVLGRLNHRIEEDISGLLVVKAFNQEERSIREFSQTNADLCRVGIKAMVWSGFIMPLTNVINNIGFTAVAGLGGMLAVNNLITIGIIASFLGYSRQFARPLNEIATIYNTLQTAMAGAERVFEVMDQEEEQKDPPDAVELKNPEGRVVFENVSFGYRPDVVVLKKISFTAEPGSVIALVGPTGAGKTTIVQLLARFYDVDEGSIRIDGRDIREYTRESLRRSFGIVLQDTYLFSGTIRENIRYGKTSATDSEIEKAAELANASLFISHLPDRYDTMLSESGANLSQGQSQLLAIARAILADAPILILDEATSSVDTRTELHIQEAMIKLMAGRTSFIIAHRLSTIRDADNILVINDGEIAETGDHESLMKHRGAYYRLYSSQMY